MAVLGSFGYCFRVVEIHLASVAYKHDTDMSPEQWKKIDELLDDALDLPPERHSSFLDEACNGDEELRRELESLLAAHQKAGSFIETTPAKGMASALDFEKAKATSGEPAAGSLVGHKLGHYQIAALLGAGGMGDVYRARDPRLDRNVAIKVLPRHLSSLPDAMARFEREAKAVAALSHPNILAIYDFGYQDGTAYLVMELLEGATLRQRLKDTVLNWREAVKIASAIADGLAAAHAKGIIHRDIKPENIFLTNDGQIKILDFGIARVKRAVANNAATLLSQNAKLEETKPGTLMGTIGYMSPEQVRGQNVEAPGDIFSLGCMLIEMLTGERPFTRPSAPETLAAILRDDPPSIEETDQDIPIELERMVRRCLEKNPDERFQSARDLSLDLRSLLTSASGTYKALSGAHRTVTAEITPLTTGSHRQNFFYTSKLRTFALVGLLALTLGAGLYSWWKTTRTSLPSLAVLPLVNDGADKNLEFLSDGISESIIANLSPLRPKLRVISNSIVSGYKGRTAVDPRQIGRELNVRSILTGKVLQQEDMLIIRVELVDTTDGTLLWSEHYQRRRTDLMAIQEDISQQISEKLQVNLTGDERKLLAKRYTDNTEAYYQYLNGRYFWNQRTKESYQKAIEYYQKAISLDSKYALAYVGIADAYVLLYDGGTEGNEARRKAEALARQALAIDSHLAEAHATLGFTEMFNNWNWAEAEKNFKRAIELNNGYATAHHWYAILLMTQGKHEMALDEIKRAKEIEPRSFPINKDIGELLYYARRYDEAIAQLRATIESEPNNDAVRDAHFWIRNTFEAKNDLEAAVKEMLAMKPLPTGTADLQQAYAQGGKAAYWQKKLDINSHRADVDSPTGHMRMIWSLAAVGDIEQAMTLLENSLSKDHSDGLMYLKVDPRFDNLRNHPRFPELLKRMNLPY